MDKYSDLTNRRIPLRQAIPLASPLAFYFEPTDVCNFHCTFCPRNLPEFQALSKGYRHMDFPLFEKVCREIAQFPQKPKAIRLYFMGEPLAAPEFPRELALVLAGNLAERVEITTNASLLTEDKAATILRSAAQYPGTLYLRYSIYSIDAARHRDLTGSDVDPQRIYGNIKRFQAMRNSVYSGGGQTCSLTRKNCGRSMRRTRRFSPCIVLWWMR